MYKKTGFPEEDEVVLCTVKKILHNSIFVILDEYENLEGMIYIAEIAAGRIRNIRDYVKEGKTIVCKILRVNEEKKHIDLSLRRVSNMQKTNKLKEHKQEIKAEKLLQFAEKQFKINHEIITKEILKDYNSLNDFFQEVLKNKESAFKNLKISKPIIKKLAELIKEKIKPPEISLKSKFNIKNYTEKGIESIKSAFKKTNQKIKNDNLKAKFLYISAPTYTLEIKAPDYKTGEKLLKELSDNLVKEVTDLGGEAEWQKVS